MWACVPLGLCHVDLCAARALSCGPVAARALSCGPVCGQPVVMWACVWPARCHVLLYYTWFSRLSILWWSVAALGGFAFMSRLFCLTPSIPQPATHHLLCPLEPLPDTCLIPPLFLCLFHLNPKILFEGHVASTTSKCGLRIMKEGRPEGAGV